MKSLSDKELSKRKYAFPEERKFPMPDKAHVLSAIRFFNYVSPENEAKLAKEILKRMREYGITNVNVGPKNRFSKYYHRSKEDKKMNNTELVHSAKGKEWGTHKYIAKINGRYFYDPKELESFKNSARQVGQNIAGAAQNAYGQIRRAGVYAVSKGRRMRAQGTANARGNAMERRVREENARKAGHRNGMESGNSPSGNNKIYRQSDVNKVGVKAYAVKNKAEKNIRNAAEQVKRGVTNGVSQIRRNRAQGTENARGEAMNRRTQEENARRTAGNAINATTRRSSVDQAKSSSDEARQHHKNRQWAQAYDRVNKMHLERGGVPRATKLSDIYGRVESGNAPYKSGFEIDNLGKIYRQSDVNQTKNKAYAAKNQVAKEVQDVLENVGENWDKLKKKAKNLSSSGRAYIASIFGWNS